MRKKTNTNDKPGANQKNGQNVEKITDTNKITKSEKIITALNKIKILFLSILKLHAIGYKHFQHKILGRTFVVSNYEAHEIPQHCKFQYFHQMKMLI